MAQLPHLFPDKHEGMGIANNFRFSQTLAEIDRFGLELADRGHTWTPKQREAYEQRVRELKRKQRSN